MANEKRVSLIVPVYNVEKYLDRCVKSLLAQTYPHLEIILVDDGSTDESGSLCDAYARADRRVRVIHQKNGGLSAARNRGMDAASGAYLAFVDGDDFVAKHYVRTLLDACEKNGASMSACGYMEYYSQKKQIPHWGEAPCVISGEEAVTDIFTQGNRVHVMAWNKLYHRSLFDGQGIRYPVGKIHEDVFTTYRLCAEAEWVACTNEICYYYVQRQGSIVRRDFSPERLQLLEAVESIRPFVKAYSPRYDEAFRFYEFINCLTVLNAMADSDYRDGALFTRIRSRIESMLPQLRKNPCFGKKYRLTAALLGWGMDPYYRIRRVYKAVGKGRVS